MSVASQHTATDTITVVLTGPDGKPKPAGAPQPPVKPGAPHVV